MPLPGEVLHADWSSSALVLMLLLAPAVGATTEELLQDTLKSIVVSVATLLALLLFLWGERERRTPLRWHAVVLLPLALMLYALGSMGWSHAFLAGAEAIRWYLFAWLLWLGLNCFSRPRFDLLALGIHGGALVASLWTALQFWADFKGFPQGPNPASTFVNRNFFAEFAVCTLPFSVWLLLRMRSQLLIAAMAFTLGFNLVAIFMTGTRSALLAMGAMALVAPLIVWQYRRHWRVAGAVGLAWGRRQVWLAAGMLAVTVAVLGVLPTQNAALIEEHRVEGKGLTPLTRSFDRILSMTDKREYTERSFSLRWVMWKATARMIAARPLTGVGAGAWEVQIPLYQTVGSQLETDYYVHNEVLQLLAEYGVVGAAFLLGLLAYLLRAAWVTWRDRSPQGQLEGPLRATTLTGLLAFLIVSNAGFPWRLAATGAFFAVSLAVLAASDMRLAAQGNWLMQPLAWSPLRSRVLLGVAGLSLALCLYISERAVQVEHLIVDAVKTALTITASGRPNDPAFDADKARMLRDLREGIAINAHYRKLTPMAADEMAKWGDWQDAIWVWESVDRSRPYIVAILTNIARGYSMVNQFDRAFAYLERCKQLQPDAPSVRSLETILLARTGHDAEALALAKQSLHENIVDVDLVNAAYTLGAKQGDWEFVLKALALRAKLWPETLIDTLLKMGRVYAEPGLPVHDEAKALEAFRKAYALVTDADKAAVKAQVPAQYQGRLTPG